MDEQDRIVRQIRETLPSLQEERQLDAEFQRLAEFFERMKQRGCVVKKPYGLPPLDTLGVPAIAHSRAFPPSTHRD